MLKGRSNSEGLIVSGLALLAVAVRAAVRAQKKAKQNDVPYVIEEEGNLFKIYPNGSRRKVGTVKNPRYTVSESSFEFD